MSKSITWFNFAQDFFGLSPLFNTNEGWYLDISTTDEDGIELPVTIDWVKARKEISEAWTKSFPKSCVDALSKYWVNFEGANFFSPREYNFITDALDIQLSFAHEEQSFQYLQNKEALKPFVEFFWKELDTQSCDWYISLGAKRFDEATVSDYCVLFAILWIEKANNDIDTNNLEYVYEYIDKKDDIILGTALEDLYDYFLDMSETAHAIIEDNTTIDYE